MILASVSSDNIRLQQSNTDDAAASSPSNVQNASQNSPVVPPIISESHLHRAQSDNLCNDSQIASTSSGASQKSQSAPTDLSPIGSDWKKQVFSQTFFPKDKDNRNFLPRWVDRYEWIEYSQCTDAVFCFACRQFGRSSSKDDVFTKVGYKSWKLALQKNKGFDKHNQSAQHIQNMALWKERESRRKNASEISTQLSKNAIEKRQYYVKSLIRVVKFLASNELPFRGDWDNNTNSESGLFTNLLEYTLQTDEKLKTCLDVIPQNAMYTSPDVQNELIAIMAELVRKQIVEEVNSSDGFTLLVDGTKDRNNNEIISIAVRYVVGSTPKESLLSFEKSDSLCARPIADFVIAKLTEFGVELSKMISQCYDGANVMKGDYNGIQTIVQQKLNRIIPYVHCFNHRLHLVVIAAIEKINAPSLFFGEIKMLYNFFRRWKVKQIYEGSAISKVIDTRWSGHKRAIDAVYNNYKEIVDTLNNIKSGNESQFDGEDIALAIGIFNAIQKREFILMLLFLKRVLDILEPANKLLQSREMSYVTAMPLIDLVIEDMKKLQNEESFNGFETKATEFMTKNDLLPVQTRRTRRPSVWLADYEVTETTGERDPNQIKLSYFEVLEKMVDEMGRRFTENSEILQAISTSDQMNLQLLKPLSNIGIEMPSEAEMQTAKDYIEKKKNEMEEDGTILSIIEPVKAAFPKVYKLFSLIYTFGCSTAVCESSFSALSRIDIVKRSSMNSNRLCNLSFLAYNKKVLNNIGDDEIMKKFSKPNRRILF